jgi:hypothetical protein
MAIISPIVTIRVKIKSKILIVEFNEINIFEDISNGFP